MNRYRPVPRAFIQLVLAVILVISCTSDRLRESASSNTTFRAQAIQRISLRAIGADTLSDSAWVTTVSSDPSGDALVAVVADPEQGVSAALVIASDGGGTPALVWPDSVTAVWWPAPHRLAFTTQTGRGVRVIIDVHAAQLVIVDTIRVIPEQDTMATWVPDSAIRQRAQVYIDSLHAQTQGRADQSMLTYRIVHYVPAPHDSLIAFHVTATDAAGRESNPAWFVMGQTSLGITRIDYVIGPATELPSKAATWGRETTLYYAKGRALWQAEIEQVTTAVTAGSKGVPPP